MNLHFAKNLQRFGEQTALLLPDGTAISYLKLAQLADHFAQRFVQFDVWPQQVCALLCRNNLTTVVAYLCCLRHQRPLVLLDANLPQSQLDPLIRQGLQDELLELQNKLSKTIVFVSHDLDEALKLGSRIAIMKDGKIIQYSVPVGGMQLIALDTVVPGASEGSLCTERLQWLEAELARHTSRPVVIAMHHPPFATGIGHMDGIGLRDG